MKLQIQKSTLETDLIKACKKQNARAQRLLYEKYASSMLGLCRRYVRGDMEAEDVMIRGFMKVFSKIKLFEGKGSFEGWMKRIMVNEALGYLRKNKAMYLETDIDVADKEPDFGMLDSVLEAKDLLNMINDLPSGYRTVFNLYAIEGYAHKEIGELLGINENTSKSQLSRARMHLQRKLLEAEQLLEKKKINQDGKKA
ncbi:MAG: RNA polymerase sigma factor [Cytophagales bacterium]|nr:RNA polymerase sigma factor [Cytophagales bacterium]